MIERREDGIVSFITHSPDETRRLGEILGGRLRSGQVLTLKGDLGSGKTVFVQGLAQGLAVPETFYVTSPTYTLINEYPGRFRLFHMDLYRLSGVEELEDIGFTDILGANGVIAVEWPERLPAGYLNDCLSIELWVISEGSRKIDLIPYGQAAMDLVEALKNCF